MSSALKDLLEAKRLSDAKQYVRKSEIVRRMIAEKPEDWEEDSRQGRFVGLTHKPTGFRLHLPASHVKLSSRWEKGPELVLPKRRNQQHAPLWMEEILASNPGAAPKTKEERELLLSMALARPEHLKGVRVYAGDMDPKLMFHQIKDNPRTSWLGKGVGYLTRWPNLLASEGDLRGSGPFYDPLTDSVYAPWDAPGASMHELGHAIDFNRGGIPLTWPARQVKGLSRDLYTLAPFTTLWKEHMAWNSGRKALEEGAAMRGKKFEDIERVVESDAHARYPALGSYWGGTLGMAGMIPLILKSMDPDTTSPVLWRYLAALSPVAGVLGGVGAGVLLRNSLKKRRMEKGREQYERRTNNRKVASAGPFEAATKSSNYGDYQRHNVQTLMPLGERRDLTPKENERAYHGQRQLIPKIFQNLSDDPTVRLSTPWVPAGVGGLGGTLLGAVLAGGFSRGDQGPPPALAAALMLGLGTTGGLIGYHRKKQKNQDILETMRRLPEGSTLRDFEADPLMAERRQMAQLRSRSQLQPGVLGYVLGKQAAYPSKKKELIARGSCCGENCRDCPYDPRHTRGATRLKKEDKPGPFKMASTDANPVWDRMNTRDEFTPEYINELLQRHDQGMVDMKDNIDRVGQSSVMEHLEGVKGLASKTSENAGGIANFAGSVAAYGKPSAPPLSAKPPPLPAGARSVTAPPPASFRQKAQGVGQKVWGSKLMAPSRWVVNPMRKGMLGPHAGMAHAGNRLMEVAGNTLSGAVHQIQAPKLLGRHLENADGSPLPANTNRAGNRLDDNGLSKRQRTLISEGKLDPKAIPKVGGPDRRGGELAGKGWWDKFKAYQGDRFNSFWHGEKRKYDPIYLNSASNWQDNWSASDDLMKYRTNEFDAQGNPVQRSFIGANGAPMSFARGVMTPHLAGSMSAQHSLRRAWDARNRNNFGWRGDHENYMMPTAEEMEHGITPEGPGGIQRFLHYVPGASDFTWFADRAHNVRRSMGGAQANPNHPELDPGVVEKEQAENRRLTPWRLNPPSSRMWNPTTSRGYR